LTNILRDVREDALRGRVYIPGELLGGREATPALFTGAPAAGMEAVIRAMADRAAGCYAASAGLEQRVHPDGRNCLWAMTQVYSRLLDRIRYDPAVVLRGPRLRLTRCTKLWIAIQALCR
jgi:phytoene synthase